MLIATITIYDKNFGNIPNFRRETWRDERLDISIFKKSICEKYNIVLSNVVIEGHYVVELNNKFIGKYAIKENGVFTIKIIWEIVIEEDFSSKCSQCRRTCDTKIPLLYEMECELISISGSTDKFKDKGVWSIVTMDQYDTNEMMFTEKKGINILETNRNFNSNADFANYVYSDIMRLPGFQNLTEKIDGCNHWYIVEIEHYVEVFGSVVTGYDWGCDNYSDVSLGYYYKKNFTFKIGSRRVSPKIKCRYCS